MYFLNINCVNRFSFMDISVSFRTFSFFVVLLLSWNKMKMMLIMVVVLLVEELVMILTFFGNYQKRMRLVSSYCWVLLRTFQRFSRRWIWICRVFFDSRCPSKFRSRSYQWHLECHRSLLKIKKLKLITLLLILVLIINKTTSEFGCWNKMS